MDIERMKDFLIDIFDLTICDRPPFGFPGYWLGKNNIPLFHLAPGGRQDKNTGVIGHVAISIEKEEKLYAALDRENVLYQVTWLPERPVKQIFFRGPEGLTIEAIIYDITNEKERS
jgi:catechol 2,3-dioxygenase-like lactoylglutathione lyase family enzyme